MTDKTPQPHLPTLFRTDEKGVLWSYDPMADRWSASVNGKKMSSKDFEKVSDKVVALQAQATSASTASTASQATVPVDLLLMCVSREKQIHPVMVRSEWNAAKGCHTILRYQEYSVDGSKTTSGWQSSSPDGLTLLHPECLSDKDRTSLARMAQGEEISKAKSAARQTLVGEWLSSKQIQDPVIYGFKFEAGKPMVSVSSNSFDRMSSRRQAAVSPNLPHLALPGSTSVKWQGTEDGQYRCGEVSVRLGAFHRMGMDFEVWADRWDQPVYAGKFSQALRLAEATHVILTQNASPIQEWEGPRPERADKIPTLPTLWEVWGGAVLAEEGIQSSLEPLVLRRPLPTPIHVPKKSHDTPHLGVSWQRSYIYGGPQYFLAGPEDRILERLVKTDQASRAGRMALGLIEGPSGDEETLETSSSSWRVNNSLPLSWSAQQDVLRSVMALRDDDPESMIVDPVALANRFQRERARIERVALADPVLVDALAAITQAAASEPAPAPRGKKP